MWHDVELADDMSRVDLADAWMNGGETRGIIFVQWYGATWPRRGLPRGTLLFWCLKIIWSLWGSNPRPPLRMQSLGKVWAANAPTW
jgi:hypothetical protein